MLLLEEWGISLKLKDKKNSLIFKTLLNIIVFSITILLVLWIFQIAFLNFFYEKYTIRNMNEVREQILKIRPDKLDNSLEKISYDNNVCMEKIDSNLLTTYNTKMKGCQLGRNNRDIINFELKI